MDTMSPALNGQITLPVEDGARFDTGRFLSRLAVRLEQCGATVQRRGARIVFEDLRFLGSWRALIWCDGSGEVQARPAGLVLC
jgi:hypothetical protein